MTPLLAKAETQAIPVRRMTRGVIRRFARDRSGVSAIEFAIVTPLLLLLLLGMSDITPTIMARFQLNHATEATGDLVTEYSLLQTSDVLNVYAAASDMLAPFPSTTLTMRITNVYSDGNGHAYVYWSCGQGALPPWAARSAVTTTPTGATVNNFVLLSKGQGGAYMYNGTNTSYVMAESQYVYTPPAQFVIRSPITFTNTAYLLPREASYVGFPWDGVATDAPPAPTTTSKSTSVTLSNGVVCNYAY
jgi:Flp pilus assembly protein TadG